MLGDTRFGRTSERLPNISRFGPMSERLPNASLPVRTSPHDMFLHTVDRHSSPFRPTSECLPNVFRFGPTSESLPNIFWINFLFGAFPLSISLFVLSLILFLFGVIPLFIYFPLTPYLGIYTFSL